MSIEADPVPRKSIKMARWMVGWKDGGFSFQENWVGWLDGLGFSCFLNDLGVIPLKQMALKLFEGMGDFLQSADFKAIVLGFLFEPD